MKRSFHNASGIFLVLLLSSCQKENAPQVETLDNQEEKYVEQTPIKELTIYDQSLFVKYYEATLNEIIEVKELSAKIRYLSSDDIYSISQLFSNKNDHVSSMVFFNHSINYDDSWGSKSYNKVINKFKKTKLQ